MMLTQQRHFRGALRAWDCKYFVWKNCPVYLQGEHEGHSEGGKKTLTLEAVADCKGYRWIIFFGTPGSLNNLDVLDRAPLFPKISQVTLM
jgi:hypothetical protein